jgi:hypothetical protein
MTRLRTLTALAAATALSLTAAPAALATTQPGRKLDRDPDRERLRVLV